MGEVSFVGVDWATKKHDVCVVDSTGENPTWGTFTHSPEGLDELCSWIRERAGQRETRVATERAAGALVEALMDRGFAVHTINPKQLDRFRDRFTTAGVKDDRLDARVLADSLRTDPRAFRQLTRDSAAIEELRQLNRGYEDVVGHVTCLLNQVSELVASYFPQAAVLLQNQTEWGLAVLEKFPTPAHVKVGTARRSILTIMKAYGARKNVGELVEQLRGPGFSVSPAYVKGASQRLLHLVRLLQLAVRQRNEMRAAVEARLGAMAEDDEPGQVGEQRDVAIVLSFPGIGTIGAATLLTEAGGAIQRRDCTALRAVSGVAPVTARSGKSIAVHMRYARNKRLGNACFHWARGAVLASPYWRAQYAKRRAEGKPRAHALRCLADRLIRRLMAMLRDGTTYDPAREPAVETPPEAAA